MYYLVPKICLNTPDSPTDPWEYIATTRQEVRFLVCKEFRGRRLSWDGISYQKVGDAWKSLHPVWSINKGTRLFNELEGEFCKRYTADQCNWRQVLEVVHSLGATNMSRKYGTRAVFSLIYDGHGVSRETSVKILAV